MNRNVYTCENTRQKLHTTTRKLLDVCSFGYQVVCCSNEKHTKPVKVYRGDDAGVKFIECLMNEEIEINEILKKNESMKMSKTDVEEHREATH